METKIEFDGEKLFVTREYDAPREAVFDAWVETSKIQVWWGCDQTKSTESCVEQKVGGKFDHIMQHEMAGEMKVCARFTEYDPPARMAYEMSEMMGMPGAPKVVIDFIELDGERTRIELVQTGLPEEVIPHVKVGLSASLRKLGEFLTAEAAA